MWQSGSWLSGAFPRQQWPTFGQSVGFIPNVPGPNRVNQTSTMMGGWKLAIPQTSKNKELTWELITLMVNIQE